MFCAATIDFSLALRSCSVLYSHSKKRGDLEFGTYKQAKRKKRLIHKTFLQITEDAEAVDNTIISVLDWSNPS